MPLARGPPGPLRVALDAGKARLTKGDIDDAVRFVSVFEPPATEPLRMADR